MNICKLCLNIFFRKKQPISLIHLISRRCNARCKHCFIDFNSSLSSEQELSTDEIIRLTRTFGDLLYSVYISGGEPFLRKDIFDIVMAYCQNSEVQSVNIATNGMYTEAIERFLEQFCATNKRKRLMFSISIDNFEELHDKNRNAPGLYKKAVQTYKLIESFKDPEIIPTVAITVTPWNSNNVTDVYRSLRSIGIRGFNAILMREQGVVKSIVGKRKVLNAHRELVKLIEADQFKGNTAGNGNDLLGCYVNARNNVFNKVLPDIYFYQKHLNFNCSAGSLFGVIFPNGDVCPCEVQEHYVMGNLRDYDMDFMKLWKSKKAKMVCREMRNEKCACTFDGSWALNVISNYAFLPRLLFSFCKTLPSHRIIKNLTKRI